MQRTGTETRNPVINRVYDFRGLAIKKCPQEVVGTRIDPFHLPLKIIKYIKSAFIHVLIDARLLFLMIPRTKVKQF